MQLHLHVADKDSTLHLSLFNPTDAMEGRVVHSFAVAAASLPQRLRRWWKAHLCPGAPDFRKGKHYQI